MFHYLNALKEQGVPLWKDINQTFIVDYILYNIIQQVDLRFSFIIVILKLYFD